MRYKKIKSHTFFKSIIFMLMHGCVNIKKIVKHGCHFHRVYYLEDIL